VAADQSARFTLGPPTLLAGLDLKVHWKHSRTINSSRLLSPTGGRTADSFAQSNVRVSPLRPLSCLRLWSIKELYSVQELVALYGLRWHVELNLRYLKVQMGLGFLNMQIRTDGPKGVVCRPDRLQLIRATMLLAASKALLDPLSLSFSSSARDVREVLLQWANGQTFDEPKVLAAIAKCRLPKRKKPRPIEPRLVRHIRESFGPLRGSRRAARKRLQK